MAGWSASAPPKHRYYNKGRYIWEEPPRAGLGPRPRTCGKVRRQLPSFPTHFNFVGEIGLLPRVAFSTGKPLCVAGWSASAPPKHRYYYKQEGTYGKSRPAIRAAASNLRKGPKTTTLLSNSFQLRWRDRTLAPGGFLHREAPLCGRVVGERASEA